MKTRQFGCYERHVPVIGQGTWQFPESGKSLKEGKESLKRGIELGLTHIDTAEMYGRAEEIIADAIAGVNRDQLFIVSKVLPSNASYTGTIAALERTLKRLGTDYLDCYLLHWRGHIPLSETLAAMEKLEMEGKIRSFGVSNFDVDDLEEAISCLTSGKIACNQVLYNLGNRGIEKRLIPFCQRHDIAVVGYTPFGTVAGSTSQAYKELEQMARSCGGTVRQLILSFLTRLPGTFTIPKAARLSHVEENAGGCDLALSDEAIAELDQLFPAPRRDVPLGMV